MFDKTHLQTKAKQLFRLLNVDFKTVKETAKIVLAAVMAISLSKVAVMHPMHPLRLEALRE